MCSNEHTNDRINTEVSEYIIEAIKAGPLSAEEAHRRSLISAYNHVKQNFAQAIANLVQEPQLHAETRQVIGVECSYWEAQLIDLEAQLGLTRKGGDDASA